MKATNKYLSIGLITLLILGAIGCSDFLDKQPLGQVHEGTAPAGGIGSKINKIYGLTRSYNITAGIPAFLIHMVRSEDSEKGSDLTDGADQAEFFDNFVYHANNGSVKAYWNHNYKIIVEANDVIASLKDQNLEDLTIEEKANLGEAYFFRAFCFFNMVRAFGEVPKIDFPVETVEDGNIPKSPVEDIYELIDHDLSSIVDNELLPVKWKASSDIGRLTYGAARALQARTFMMRNDWPKMLSAAEDVIGLGVYDLKTPYDQIFTEKGEYSSESVFELGCLSTPARPSDNAIGSQFCEVQGVRGTPNLGWGWHMATKELGEAYESGDPRKDATLLYFRRSVDEPITELNSNKPDGESPVSTAMGAYFNKKAYVSPSERSSYTSNSGKWVNIRLIRYADVVLMAAEASNELGKLDSALKYLEEVRARARGGNDKILPEITKNSIGGDVAELRKKIHYERRIELALEPDRFYDLVRWGTAKEVLSKAGKTNYEPRHRYIPIPQDIIDQSGGILIQNPDYSN